MILLIGCQRITSPESSPSSSLHTPFLFGPIVTPMDSFFHNLSLIYRTPLQEKTHIRFTMTGHIDWYLERENNTTIHHVLFEDVEEETSYSFLPENFPSNHLTTIQTPPFTTTKHISFAIMRTSSSWKHENIPAFTILVSDTPTVEEKDFLHFYENNLRLAHHSILCPTFTTSIEDHILGKEVSWYWFCYGTVIVLVLKNQLPSEPLFLYLSASHEKKNFIIAVNFSLSEWEKLLSYQKVAHLIPFEKNTESLLIDVSNTISTFYSYKK